MSGVDLSNSILREANLIGANFTGANLEGADLTNAVIGGTIFGNVDLSNVKGLESLVHLGPSTVGIDTIYKSRGKVPVVFLKNAGVARHLIDYIELFVDQNKKYSSCFISYSKKNQEFAHKLYEDLQAHGVRCWLATEKFKRRDRNNAIVDAAVNLHDKLIMIFSEDSIASDWAENKCNHAIEKEVRCGKTVLVPISIDDGVKYTEQPWVIKIRRSRYASDFSMWQDNDSYQEAFSYLLEELNAEEQSSGFDEFEQEEFNAEDDFSAPAKEVIDRKMAQELRDERRQLC